MTAARNVHGWVELLDNLIVVVTERYADPGPPSVPGTPSELAPAAIGRTAAWLAKQVELALAAADLSLPQYRILGLLTEGSAVSSALAERLAVRPPSITAVVDGLVSRGLVERRHAEDDRRRVAHVLTAKGENLLDTANEAVDSRLAGIAGSLESADLTARALEGLALWRHAMAAYHQTAETGSTGATKAVPG
jgi:long-chain acyl-CoA synthetase